MSSPPIDPAGGPSAPPQPVSERAARTVLRKLRDLDLRTRHLLVQSGRVGLEGCMSPDAPVEEGLAYRLRLADGSSARLDLSWRGGALELGLEGAGARDGQQRVELVTDELGRALAPSIRARMHPEACDRREVEHFLRRLVRAAFRAPRVA